MAQSLSPDCAIKRSKRPMMVGEGRIGTFASTLLLVRLTYNGRSLVSVQNCTALGLHCPNFGSGWFGGKSSTRTTTLRLRLRNSCGSESSPLDEVLALHPSPTEVNRGRSLRVAIVRFLVLIVIFSAVALVFLFFLLFVFFLVGLLSEGECRRLPTDQERLGRETLDVFCSCPMVRLAVFGKRRQQATEGHQSQQHRTVLTSGTNG
jgi:hypothetical protein